MPTAEEYQKRLERLVKLGNRLRVTQILYNDYPGANAFSAMVDAQDEFDKALSQERKITRQAQESGGYLPF